eukprot:TRINITY_DN390_c1_g1_i1.p1 TRINITY_DN390_c1_g1~~TRINITY_DN390_c1_g1_i1.p1  ORF type:complete len:660 (+),score=58.30 TRINITY_DN390_c1_g1_i1:167-2146(+)
MQWLLVGLVLLVSVSSPEGKSGFWTLAPGSCVNKEGGIYSYMQWSGVSNKQVCTVRVRNLANKNAEGLVLGWEYSINGQCRALLSAGATSANVVSTGPKWDTFMSQGNASTAPEVGDSTDGWECGYSEECFYPKSAPRCQLLSTVPEPSACACVTYPSSSTFCASSSYSTEGRQCTTVPSNGCPSTATLCTAPPNCTCDANLSQDSIPNAYCASVSVFSPTGRACSAPTSGSCGQDTLCAPSPLIPIPTNELHTSAPPNEVPPVCQCSANTSLSGHPWFCASRTSWSSSGRACLDVHNPGQQCDEGMLKCHNSNSHGHTNFKPSGVACVCKSYLGSCKVNDPVLCVGDGGECYSPDSDGRCNASSSLCTGRMVYRVAVKLTDNDTVDYLLKKIAEAADVPANKISLESMCPKGACPGGGCPGSTEKKNAAGCVNGPTKGDVEGGVTYYVDLDILENDETVHSQVVEALFQNVDNVMRGIKVSSPQTDALVTLNVTYIESVYPAVGSAPPVEATPKDGKPWWKVYWWAALICVLVLGIVGVIARKTVKFHEEVNFDSSRKTDTKKQLPKGMEGCYRTHRKSFRELLMGRPRSASRSRRFLPEDQELCVDSSFDIQLPCTEYIKYTPLEITPQSRKGKGSNGSVRSRSSESTASSEPEMLI